MALYSPNVNLRGAKVIYTSQSAVSLGASTQLPLIVLPVDPDYMQDTTDGYDSCTANTDTGVVKFTATAAVKKNEWTGLYAYVQGLDQSRLIDANTAADLGAEVTVYVSRPYTSAPTLGNSVNIRRWEKLYVPKLMSSLEEFAEQYMAKSGNTTTWTNSEAAYDSIVAFKNAGGSFFYALPVEVNSTLGATEAVANMSATTNADFLVAFDALSPKPDAIVLSKQPSLPVTIAASDWGTGDAAWTTFVDNRATVDTTDEDLTAMVYITDTASASSASAITYRATTWAPTSERAVLCHGLHNVADGINGGRSREINCACSYAGACNKIATTTAESFGHAVGGVKTAIGGVKSLSEDLTKANRLLLQSNGINALIFKPASGYYFENQYTMKANTNTAGETPEEHVHVMLSKNKIWNAAKRVLQSIVDEQNVVTNRLSVQTKLTVLLDQYITQRIITAFAIADTTTGADEDLGIARFSMSVSFPAPIGWVELTIHSSL